MLPTAPHPSRRPSVVIVAADVVGSRMAGPGIRFVRIAEQLSKVADVSLAIGIDGSDPSGLGDRGFRVIEYRGRDDLIEIVAAHDIAFCQLIDEEVVRRGLAAGCRFIFDLYNALPAEAIGAERIGGFDTQPQMDDVFVDVLRFFRFSMRAGSYFVTSNERQRDFWIGYMISSEGLLPSNLDGRDVERVIGLVPFGMEEDEPTADQSPLRGRLGIARDDVIVLWAGGIWDWFDAETPIRAIAEIRRARSDVRLVFYGTTHPNPLIGRPHTVERAMRLADDLGVLGNGVHFIDGWVPAAQRAGYLLDADLAISAHKPSFETRYAFRTRILDHFWARLPSIVTEGDWFADYISAQTLGEVVKYADVASTAAAIGSLAEPERRRSVRANVVAIRDEWRWSATTKDLLDAVRDWEQRLPLRTLPATGAPPAPVQERSAVRKVISRSPLGAIYRAVRKRLAR